MLRQHPAGSRVRIPGALGQRPVPPGPALLRASSTKHCLLRGGEGVAEQTVPCLLHLAPLLALVPSPSVFSRLCPTCPWSPEPPWSTLGLRGLAVPCVSAHQEGQLAFSAGNGSLGLPALPHQFIVISVMALPKRGPCPNLLTAWPWLIRRAPHPGSKEQLQGD